MGNCCCLVSGQAKKARAKKAKKAKKSKYFECDDYDDAYDIEGDADHCVNSGGHAKKNIRRGGGGTNGGGGVNGRRPKNSKNNKQLLATYLATDLPNNASKSHLLNNTNATANSTTRAMGNAKANVSSVALLSPSVNSFVGNMLNANQQAAENNIQPFPVPHKSTVTYYQNKFQSENGASTAPNSNGNAGCAGGSGKFFCGVTSSSASNMQAASGTPSRRGCDNSQIMNNLNKGSHLATLHFFWPKS